MSDEPQFSEEPDIPKKGSISQRRIKSGRPSLSLEAIVESSQEHLQKPEVPVKVKFRGFVDCRDPQRHPELVKAEIDAMKDAVRVMSYNILASRYVSTDKYRFCPTWALAEPYRGTHILTEISTVRPDLLFFQELSSEMHKSDYFGAKLCSPEFGYDSFHVPISDKSGKSHAFVSSGSGVASSMSSNGSYTNEGSATNGRVVRASGGAGGGVHRASTGSGGGAQQANSSEFSVSNGIPISEDAVRPEFEGVAIFFNKRRFEVQEHLPVKFNIIAGRDDLLDPFEKKRVSVSSHNVAVLSVLRDRVSNEFYICACTHTYWDWSRPECQVWQIITLLKEIEELESSYSELGATHVVFGGDLNSERNSLTLHYILNKRVEGCPTPHPGAPPPNCFVKYTNAQHSLDLRSCYDRYSEWFPDDVSATGPNFRGIIDHLFCSRSLTTMAVLKLGEAIEIPTVDIPSDHYPVASVLVPTAEIEG